MARITDRKVLLILISIGSFQRYSIKHVKKESKEAQLIRLIVGMKSWKKHLYYPEKGTKFRSSQRRCSIEKVKKFLIFTGEHLVWSFLLILMA